jgi:ABC-type lipoprotein export system ATPase subunit
MGPSGSGKTTLLSILGCILTPSEGTLRIAGQSTEGLGRKASPPCAGAASVSSSSPTTCSRR